MSGVVRKPEDVYWYKKKKISQTASLFSTPILAAIWRENVGIKMKVSYTLYLHSQDKSRTQVVHAMLARSASITTSSYIYVCS